MRPAPSLSMPGRTHVAAPGQPQCPADGCERPAGFGTDHEGEGACRRHDGGRTPNRRTRKRIAQRERPAAQPSHPAAPAPTPTPSPEPAKAETAPVADPLARRLTGSSLNPSADPLAVLRRVLASARRAGYPFGEAWALGAEAALSYMNARKAEEWWAALNETERAWADAYAQTGSLLAALKRHAT